MIWLPISSILLTLLLAIMWGHCRLISAERVGDDWILKTNRGTFRSQSSVWRHHLRGTRCSLSQEESLDALLQAEKWRLEKVAKRSERTDD